MALDDVEPTAGEYPDHLVLSGGLIGGLAAQGLGIDTHRLDRHPARQVRADLGADFAQYLAGDHQTEGRTAPFQALPGAVIA